MNSGEKRKQLYEAAIDRAMKWIVSNQEKQGSFGDVRSMAHYMALGASLLYNGRSSEASRLMSYIRQTYVSDDGDFDMPEIRERIPGRLLECRYMPSWVIYSAHVNLALDISMRGIPHILKYQDPQTGGVFGTIEARDAGKGIINTAVTCLAGMASLITGHVVEAGRMGDHIVDNLIAQNPDLKKAFYPIWDTTVGLRTDDDAPASPNVPKVLRRNQSAQGHFLTGMMIAFLSDLYQISKHRKYLNAAICLYDFGAGGTPAIYESTLSHKFAWGCAWLYRQTGQVQHLDSACRMCDYLVKKQEADGSFVTDNLPENWPYQSRLNLTSQFALWLRHTANLL